MARKPAELRPIMTRLPEGLRLRISKAAKKAGRSMNAEIIYRLSGSFQTDDLDRLEKQISEILAILRRE